MRHARAGFEGFRITAMARNLDDACASAGVGGPRRPARSTPRLVGRAAYVNDDVHPGESSSDDLDRMLAERHDAVYILTPATHCFALRALAAGKHVAVEKPMAITVRAARRMIEAAQAAERVLVVLENARLRPEPRAAAWAARSGRLGDVQLLLGMMVGSAEWSPDVVIGHTPWRHDRLSGGGVTTDFGPHLLDWARGRRRD